MNNLLLRLSYDGTNFHGWQFQKTGERSVEGVLLKTWQSYAKGESIKIFCSGRTDQGVHALEQAASFHTQYQIPPEAIKKAFNSLLPSDILIHSVEAVPLDFHARYSAVERTYLYKICKKYSLFGRLYAYYHSQPLDLEAMRAASRFLIGEHDFSAFRGSTCGSKTPVRSIKEITIMEDENYQYVEFTANAFLFRMVRNLMGTLLAAGDHQILPTDVQTILAGQDRKKAPKTAPPHGLYLKKVTYPAFVKLAE